MKEEYIVKLDPEDEYTHTPDESSNYNESMYFNVFDHKKKIGGWFRLGNRPNEGYSEMSCCLYLPDGKVGFMFGKPSISDNNSFNAGGMSFEVLEPFKRLHIEYKGKILLLSDPQQMMNPGKAFKSNPTVDCQVSLGILGESPMYGGETLKKDGSALDVDPEKSFSKAHYEQHISGEGSINSESNIKNFLTKVFILYSVLSLTIFLLMSFDKTSSTILTIFLSVTLSPSIKLLLIFLFFNIFPICGPPP